MATGWARSPSTSNPAVVPLLGLSLKLAPARVVLQRADSAPGDGGVQLHVGAVESIGGVVEEISAASGVLPSRYAIPARSSRAIGSDHGMRSLAMRRAPARATDRNRRGALFAGGHRQRAARAQVERLDPNDLDAP